MKDGVAYVQAGGGIVADSVPANEYMETVHKAAAVQHAIDLAEDGLDTVGSRQYAVGRRTGPPPTAAKPAQLPTERE
jgi:anthranilate synthase component 1